MSKSRRKPSLAMPDGFFTDMPSELIQYIAETSAINDAASLAMTSKKHYDLLRRITTRRYLQSMTVIDVVRHYFWDNNIFCITESGQVYVSGGNSYAQLGLGNVDRKKGFQIIPHLTNVKQIIEFDYDMSLFVTRSGEVLTTGGVHSGRNNRENIFIRPSTTPKKVAFGKRRIVKAVTSDNFSRGGCFLTEDGEVYVVGTYHDGSLGVGKRGSGLLKRLELIEHIPKVRDVVYTGHELYLLTVDNLLYVSGHNFFGQLGLGDRESRYCPILVPNISNIKTVAIDFFRVYVLTYGGQVFAWGNNWTGLLGFGDQDEHNTPVLLTALNNIVSMDIGGGNNFFVTGAGDVYVFGLNGYGTLGMGDDMVRYQPTLNPTLHHIKQVTSRCDCTFFTTEENHIYVCGNMSWRSNSWSLREIKNVPQLIFTYARIEQVLSDYENSVWRTQDGAIYLSGVYHNHEFGRTESFFQTQVVLFPAVKKIIHNASVGDLLFYSQSERGYSRYCYQLAIEKIRAAETVPQLLDILRELNIAARNLADIKTTLPACHLVLRYGNGRDNQQTASAVATAWASLLVVYRQCERAGISKQRDFMETLTYLSSPQSNVTFFQPLVTRSAWRELRDQIQANPTALRIAAGFFLAELPPCQSPLKRKAEDQLEDEQVVSKKPKA